MRKLLVVVCLLTGLVWAQNGACRKDAVTTTNKAGFVVPVGYASITVYQYGTTTKATLYQDPNLSIPQDNPVQADDKGRYAYCADSGNYNESITGTGMVSISYQPVTLGFTNSDPSALHKTGDESASGTKSFAGLSVGTTVQTVAATDWCASANTALSSYDDVTVPAGSSCSADVVLNSGKRLRLLKGEYVAGTHGIVIPEASKGVQLDFTAGGIATDTISATGSVLTYTGTGAAIAVGGNTGTSEAQVSRVQINNPAVKLNGADNAAVAISLANVNQATITHPYVFGKGGATAQKGIYVGGGGNWSGAVVIINPALYAVNIGLHLNWGYTHVFGGEFAPLDNTTSEGIRFDAAAHCFVYGFDAEGSHIGYHFVNNGFDNTLIAHVESSTVGVQFDDTSTQNEVTVPGTVVVVDNTTAKNTVNSVYRVFDYDQNLIMQHRGENDWLWDFKQAGTTTDQTIRWRFRDKAQAIVTTILPKDANGNMIFYGKDGNTLTLNYNGDVSLEAKAGQALKLNQYTGASINVMKGGLMRGYASNNSTINWVIDGTGKPSFATGADNKATCWKTASGGVRTLGYCSTTVDASGNCTCN